MKKKLVYILIPIICFFLSCGGMLLLMRYLPTNVTENITKKVVTVNDTGISEGVNAAYDSVVVVEVYVNNKLSSTGTGFVYKKENGKGYILTNHHVVSSKGKVVVTFTNGVESEATIEGSDEYADIGVLSVPEKDIISVATLGKSSNVKLGDTVFTIGAPMGKEYAGTVTRGILSGKDRMVEVSINSYSTDWVMNVMQTDAAINPGNSGGPLCNVSGEVIGINSLKIVQDEVEGLGFSIPIEDAIEYATQLEENGSLIRPFIGIEMVGVSSSYQLMMLNIKLDSSIDSGVVVTNVSKDSPAEDAKLEKGDVIIGLNDKDITSIANFRYYLFKYSPGDQINIKIIRDGKEKVVKLKLAKYE